MNFHSQQTSIQHKHGQTDFGDQQQWRLNFKKTVGRLFSPYRKATSCHEQIDALEDLGRSLVKEVQVLSSANSLPIQSELSFLLEETARRCIIEIPIVDAGEMHKIAAAVDNILDACGIMASLTACVSCLRELASLHTANLVDYINDDNQDSDEVISLIDSQSKSMQNRVLKTSLHTIRRMLCTKSLSEPSQEAQCIWWVNDEPDNNSANHSGQTSNDIMTSLQFQSIPYLNSTGSLIDPWVGNVVVLLPQLISNACHALQVNLPSWAVTTRLYPRLVDCGLTNAFFIATTKSNHIMTDPDDGNELMTRNEAISCSSKSHIDYVAALIRHLVRRRDSDHVAAGIHGHFNNYKLPETEQKGGNAARNVIDNEPLQSKEYFERLPLFSFLRNTMSSVSPRETSSLIRSLVQHALQASHGTTSTSDGKTSTDEILIALCFPLLDISWSVQETFLRQMTFESSSIPPGPASADRRLCRITIKLLHKCDQKAGLNRRTNHDGHDYEDDDDISTDSSSTNSCNSDDPKDLNGLHRHVGTILASWKQSTFVQRTDRRLQRHVTTLLRRGLSILFSDNKNDRTGNDEDLPILSPVHDLTMGILEGVNCRLESSLEDIRRDGMKVASDLAQFMGEDLVFDELGDDDSVYDFSASGEDPPNGDLLNSSAIGTLETPCETTGDAASTPKKKKKKIGKPKSPRFLDPDAEYLSDDFEDDEEAETDSDVDTSNDSSEQHEDSTCWEGDDDLVPFDLDDDEEDLRETPRPLSLTECLSLLRAVETEETAYSQHETGLQEVTRLVRSRPDDLPDIAVSLANQLLRLENKFNIENFGKMRQDGLRSLLVQEPISVGNKLITELFEDGGLSDRLNVLSALNEATSELCGNSTYADAHRLEGSLKTPGLPKNIEGDQSIRTTDQRAVAQIAKLESQTRWKRSQPKDRASPKAVSNRFTEIAPLWFYSLVGKFMERRNDTNLWAGFTGSQLLAHLFFTLATIVDSSGSFSPGTRVLARDLFELVWSFRTVEVAEIRSAVLVAVASSIALLPENAIVTLLLSNGPGGNLPQAMLDMAQNDPDKTCRSLASSVSHSLRRVVIDSLQEPGLLEVPRSSTGLLE